MKARAPGFGACAGILMVGFAAAAVAPLDPAFLNYLELFSDAQGEVFDARELAEMPATEPAHTVSAATKSSAAHSVSSPAPSSVSRETSP
jgi:hypothetical protein